MTNRELDKMMLNLNFKCYDDHGFHEFHEFLKKSFKEQKLIFYTNICSLKVMPEKLELLNNNLNHDFDFIALPETWTSENNNLFLKYHVFKAISYKTLKGGCVII